jgi:quinol monooxygenase YgiN
MIIVTGEARFAPEAVGALRAAAAAMVPATRAEAGCVSYGYAEDVLEPGLVRISEIWSDWASLEAHFATAHMARFNAALAEIRPVSVRVVAYETGAERVLISR